MTPQSPAMDIIDVFCPSCRAFPGQPCRNMETGEPNTTYTHTPRKRKLTVFLIERDRHAEWGEIKLPWDPRQAPFGDAWSDDDHGMLLETISELQQQVSALKSEIRDLVAQLDQPPANPGPMTEGAMAEGRHLRVLES